MGGGVTTATTVLVLLRCVPLNERDVGANRKQGEGDVIQCIGVVLGGQGEKRTAEGETEGTTRAPVLIGVKRF